MTWPDLVTLLAYWNDNPPAHEVLLAIGKGFGMKTSESKTMENPPLEQLAGIAGIKISKTGNKAVTAKTPALRSMSPPSFAKKR